MSVVITDQEIPANRSLHLYRAFAVFLVFVLSTLICLYVHAEVNTDEMILRYGIIDDLTYLLSESNAQSQIISMVDSGEYVYVLDIVDGSDDGQWAHVIVNGTEGYMLVNNIETMSQEDNAKYMASLATPVPDYTNQEQDDNHTRLAKDKVDTKSGTLIVTGTATCSNYNHVGNNWRIAFSVNGKTLNKSMSITVNEGDVISLTCKITEEDKYPDIDTYKTRIDVTPELLSEGTEIIGSAHVTEGHGRYRGNTATWTVVFNIDPE